MTPRATLFGNLILCAIWTAFQYRRIGRSLYLGFVFGFVFSLAAIAEAAMRGNTETKAKQPEQAAFDPKALLLFGVVLVVFVGLYYLDNFLMSTYGVDIVRGVEFFMIFAVLVVQSIVKNDQRDGFLLWGLVMLGALLGLVKVWSPATMLEGATIGGFVAAGGRGLLHLLKRTA